MKLVPLLIFLLFLQIGILLFDNISDPNNLNMLQSNATVMINGSDTITSSLQTYNFIFNPTDWNGNTFITLLLTGLIAGGAIGIGTYFFFRSDLTILAPIFMIFVGAGIIPILSFWNVMNREIGMFACQGGSCYAATVISALICVPLSLYWIMACIEWWSGRPLS